MGASVSGVTGTLAGFVELELTPDIYTKFGLTSFSAIRQERPVDEYKATAPTLDNPINEQVWKNGTKLGNSDYGV